MPKKLLIGNLCATLAFVLWGLVPIYWKQLQFINPMDLAAHRVVWTTVILLLFLALRDPKFLWVKSLNLKSFRSTLFSAVFIAINWICFVVAINTDRILLASLGYYLNPLVNVALGRLFLKETLSPLQKVAVGIAALAVLNMTIQLDEWPWLSLVLAISFGLYGLVKKGNTLPAEQGLFMECIFILPFAVSFLYFTPGTPMESYSENSTILLLLFFAGVVTAAPLLLYNIAVKRLKLSTIGFFQYLAPSLTAILAIFYYNETLSKQHMIAFALIFIALLIYIFDNIRQQKVA